MRLAAVAAVLSAATLVARAAHADERPLLFSLAVDEPSPLEACGGAPALIEAVETRLHRPVFTTAPQADIALQVSFDAAGRGHLVERDRAGAELGQRDVTLPKGDCAKSLETLAVVLSITIGPPKTIAIAPPPPLAPPPPPPPPLAPPPPPARPPPLLLLDEGPPPWRVSPLLETMAGTGVLPQLSFGVQGGAILQTSLRRLSILARASYWPARSTETAASAEVDRAGAAVAVCYAFLRRVPASLAACGGLEAARLHSTSLALTRSSESGVLLDTFVEGRLGYRVVSTGNLVIEPVIAAQIAAVFRRDRFTYRDRSGQERTLLQPAPVAFQASIGVAVHFL